MFKSRKSRLLAATGLAAIMGVSVFAFAAANIVPGSKAGDGAGAITGYTVSNISYNVSSANPANIASWEFDLSAPAGDVRSKIVSTSTTYEDCGNTGGNHWLCSASGTITVVSADELRVIAAEDLTP